MPMGRRATPPATVADRLHSAAIHLLRRLRQTDDATGLSPARLSILSVLVFGGPRTIGALANAEQVRPPTISNLVSGLEREGLVKRRSDRDDKRVMRVSATAKGERVLQRARRLRLERLTQGLATLRPTEVAILDEAAALIERVAGFDG